MIDKEDSLYTCSCTEVATLVRLGAGAALPVLVVLANSAVISAQVIIARAPGAGQGVLSALNTWTSLTLLGCSTLWVHAPFLHRGSALNTAILTFAAVIPRDKSRDPDIS